MKVVIIGGGPGGYTAAVRSAQNGFETTLIEKANLGGTCLNWGCIPSKIFRRSADFADDMKKSARLGFALEHLPTISMDVLQARKENILSSQRKGIASLLAHHNVTVLSGDAVIGKENSVAVTVEDGSVVTVPYDKLIVATGSTPVNIPAFPFDSENVLSSNDVLGLQDVPESAIIVGGGVVGCEFAFILSALGTKVTVVEALDRVLSLPGIEKASSKVIEISMKKHGIRLLTKKLVRSVTSKNGTCVVDVASTDTEQDQVTTLEAQKVIVVVGRAPATKELGIEEVGVELSRGFIPVSETMQTANPDIYAIGDVAWAPGKAMLAHVASTEAGIAVEAIAGGNRAMSYRAVPSGIFTAPEVGNVGMTEEEAKQQGIAATSAKVLFRTLGKVQVLGELDGHAIVTVEEGSGNILGVQLVGAHATDLIAEAGILVEKKMTLHDVCDTIHAHPTVSEIMLEVCLKAAGTPLHG